VITNAMRFASSVVVPTETVRTELTRWVPGPARVHAVGEGVSEALRSSPADAEAMAARLGLPDDYVLIIGTVEPRKGHDTLIEAMARPTVPRVPLVVVGTPGWGGTDLAMIARRTGLASDRLRLLGALDDSELAAVLHRATAVAVPSLAEGFGLPLLEAMAAGVPVVHSDAPALVEVAGGAGLTARRGDPHSWALALRAVLTDRSRRRALVAAGLLRVEAYSWDAAAQAVWKVHIELHAAIRAGDR
jgi:glycosyltransferase involved in cell wall biosynthesis